MVREEKSQNDWMILVLGFILLRLLFIAYNPLLVEEAYYWNYAQHLDFGYLDHPPMVAWLIKFGTLLGETKEWAVRLASIPCWLITLYFSYKLSELIYPKSGRFILYLLAFLPFFFIHSIIITPDVPLMACWSALLFFLYKAIILEENKAWYPAGISLGLGLLSKYTLILLPATVFLWIIATPKSRKWLYHKEPYLAFLIAILLFYPVIYWNETHQWASFAFQSTRRFTEELSFSLDSLIAFAVIFLTPVGLIGYFMLCQTKVTSEKEKIDHRFMMAFTSIPLLFFSSFSLFHAIKFNWIGPLFLALLPWFAYLMQYNVKNFKFSMKVTAFIFVGIYSLILITMTTGHPEKLDKKLFFKMISWPKLTDQISQIAAQTMLDYQEPPIIVPMDSYNIGSEFLFYQKKKADLEPNQAQYNLVGSHIFGCHSVMFNYWTRLEEAKGRILVLLSNETNRFDNILIKQNTTTLTPVIPFPVYTQNGASPLKNYYYQIVKMKD